MDEGEQAERLNLVQMMLHYDVASLLRPAARVAHEEEEFCETD